MMHSAPIHPCELCLIIFFGWHSHRQVPDGMSKTAQFLSVSEDKTAVNQVRQITYQKYLINVA